jgi:hypothetical protein
MVFAPTLAIAAVFVLVQYAVSKCCARDHLSDDELSSLRLRIERDIIAAEHEVLETKRQHADRRRSQRIRSSTPV